MKSLLILITVVILVSCVHRYDDDRASYLSSGSQKVKLNIVASCWCWGLGEDLENGDPLILCGHQPPITPKKPLVISNDSRLKLTFDVRSKFHSGFYLFIPVKFLEKTSNTNYPDSIYWQDNEALDKEYEVYVEKNEIELSGELKQELDIGIPNGEYLLKFYTYWESGDIVYYSYINKI